ncbi:MAG: hypothetical protein GX117_06355 [Candidatus Hydrogenedentes bacterium]|nr:hypothetical protein [Candidatus Hydrogenedentota bacterium]
MRKRRNKWDKEIRLAKRPRQQQILQEQKVRHTLGWNSGFKIQVGVLYSHESSKVYGIEFYHERVV